MTAVRSALRFACAVACIMLGLFDAELALDLLDA